MQGCLEKINKILSENIESLLPDNRLAKFVTSGSKFIHSRLAINYIRANEKELNDNLYYLLSAGELIHNASLLHDDVIDSSEIRRGKSTISCQYSPDVSVLCGDYLVSRAVELLSKLQNSEILNIFNKCVQSMTQAEICQYFLRGKIPDKNTYIQICKGKTAGLFSAILESSSIISDIDKDIASEFGQIYGICYQIKNDFEDTSANNDRKNQIFTAKDIFGIENAKILSDNYKEELRGLIITIPENTYKVSLKGLIDEL